MEKRLKDFINDNKEQFDDQQIPWGLWSNISEALDKNSQHQDGEERAETVPVRTLKKAIPRRLLKIAASIALLIIAGTSIYFYGKKQGYEDYARINPELAATQGSYQVMVNQKKDSVAFFSSRNPDLEAEFVETLTQMEKNYEALKAELPSSPNQERILEAMILNLQAQTAVLNQQMIILHKLTSHRNETI